MSTTTEMPGAAVDVALSAIELPANVRALDPAHVARLAGSIALRGLIVPLTVRPTDVQGRYELVAGFHRHAACLEVGFERVAVVVRFQYGESADRAAENIVRQDLDPLEEARAVQAMLEQGYTPAGAAQALGWSQQRVTARVKVLELPALAQELLATEVIPVSAVDTLRLIHEASPQLGELVAALVGEQAASGDSDFGRQLARDPGWLVGQAIHHGNGQVWARYLTATHAGELAVLKLGKRATQALERADELHHQLDRYAYGPLRIPFGEGLVDQARAAGVLLELHSRAPLILDRGVYRELAKQAIARLLEDLEERAAKRAQERSEGRAAAKDRLSRRSTWPRASIGRSSASSRSGRTA